MPSPGCYDACRTSYHCRCLADLFGWLLFSLVKHLYLYQKWVNFSNFFFIIQPFLWSVDSYERVVNQMIVSCVNHCQKVDLRHGQQKKRKTRNHPTTTTTRAKAAHLQWIFFRTPARIFCTALREIARKPHQFSIFFSYETYNWAGTSRLVYTPSARYLMKGHSTTSETPTKTVLFLISCWTFSHRLKVFI